MRVVVVGSINRDVTMLVDRLPRPGETVLATDVRVAQGGKGANQGAAAALQGADVSLVGCVGDDDAGAAALAALRDRGVDVSTVAVVAGVPTGTAHVLVAADGTNQICVAPLANDALTPELVMGAARSWTAGTVLLTQLEVPLATVEAALVAGRAAGLRTILNPAPARSLPAGLLALVDVVVPNRDELVTLTGETDVHRGAQRLLEAGAGSVVVTLGRAGALAVSPDGVREVEPIEVVEVDATAAGDAFCGTLAAATAAGHDRATALRRAAVAGGLAVTRPGALDALPARADVDARA